MFLFILFFRFYYFEGALIKISAEISYYKLIRISLWGSLFYILFQQYRPNALSKNAPSIRVVLMPCIFHVTNKFSSRDNLNKTHLISCWLRHIKKWKTCCRVGGRGGSMEKICLHRKTFLLFHYCDHT